MRVVWIAATALLLVGCPGGTDADDSSVDLNGTWSGPITVMAAGQQQSTVQTLVLTLAGSSITGTARFEGDSETGNVSGSLEGSTAKLVLTAVRDAADDCHLYPTTWTYGVARSQLALQSVSGQACQGDGRGGHRALLPLTGGSGTLTRR